MLQLISKIPYALAIGSLIYVMVATCFDIAFPLEVVSEDVTNPSEKHWEAVKGIHDEIPNDTKDLCVSLGKWKASINGFSCPNYVHNWDCRKSIFRYAFTFTTMAISWISRLHKCVALSTTIADYVVANKA